ncbi:MAG: hypothetical protein JWM41_2429 [Gemmatimonadetes bacterium]|nr:hypothetical protein [Gemmatimonadota bacterium]
MLTTRRHVQPIPFRSTNESGPDTRFPRAVAGEQFDRYARVVWSQGQRWVRKHWHRVSSADFTMHDARETLRSFAAIDLSRRLYPQEEQLLSEVLQEAWNDEMRQMPDIVPEIPSFLRSTPPRTPRPAA